MNTNKKLLLIPLALVFLSVLVSASSVQTALFYDATNSSSLSIMNGQNVGIIIDANSILENSMTVNVSLLDSSGKLVSNLVNVYTTNNTYSNYLTFGQGTYLSSGSYTIVSMVVSASGQTATAKLSLQVLPTTPTNTPPVITSTPVTQVNSSQLYNYQVVATDADGDSLTYSLTQAPQLPAWLSMNSAGLISGTAPNVTSDYQYLVTVNVSDGKSFVTQTYTLTVHSSKSNPANFPPTIVSSPVTQVNESALYNYQVVATDADNSTLIYSLAGPSWLSINSAGLVSGTSPSVTADTSYTVTVSVSDGINAPVSQTYILTVLNVIIIPPGNNTAPVITSFPVLSVNESQAYSYQVIATDADGDALSYSFSGPSWLLMNSSTGLLSGTSPSVTADINYTITVSVSDGINAPVSQTYILTVVNVPSPAPNGSPGGGSGTMTGILAPPDLSFENQQYFAQFAPKSVVAEDQPATQTGSSALFWIILAIVVLIIILALAILMLRRNKK